MLQASDYSLLKKIYYKNKKKISINKNHKKTKVLDKDKHNLNMLNQNGFCVLKGVFSKKYIDEHRSDFQKQIRLLKNISIPRDLTKQTKKKEEIFLPKIKKNLFDLGEKKFKNYTDSIKIKDPLINLPRFLDIVLNKRIISICSNYFGYKPYLTFLKCFKSYANNLSAHDTQHFHIDESSIKLLKVFIYLNDVNSKKDGPFYYIKKSFLDAKKKWGLRLRWDEKYLKSIYNKKNFVPILAKRGDVIIANTVAFHKGLKPIKKNRNILILNYGLHMDYSLNNKPDIKAKISKKDYKLQSKENRIILDLLEKVN
ncbi:phytanoyl-CoA dioxygenase family protein [Candidatus Pelagibacter sp.]|jgi:hypothetical protein|nr:phytanoyl-CoA dioxygenase family protein [Candidatus Pelagibacter sp.]